MTDATAPASSDRLRQITVTISEVLCVLGTLVGVGVFGTRVEESSGGRLAADATLIAPAVGAFSIWSVIYLGLAAYTVWQWLPGRAVDPRLRSVGWLAAVSMLLNAGWLLVTQQGWLVISVVVMLALLATLGELVRRLVVTPASASAGLAERVIVDGTFGLYLGWVCVATCANIAATLVANGVSATGGFAVTATVVVLVVVALVGWFLAGRLAGQPALALGIVWGLAWVAIGRLTDQPASTTVGITAAVVAIVVAGVFARQWRAGASQPA